MTMGSLGLFLPCPMHLGHSTSLTCSSSPTPPTPPDLPFLTCPSTVLMALISLVTDECHRTLCFQEHGWEGVMHRSMGNSPVAIPLQKISLSPPSASNCL